MTFKKAEMSKTLKNGLGMIETNPLNHNWLDLAIQLGLALHQFQKKLLLSKYILKYHCKKCNVIKALVLLCHSIHRRTIQHMLCYCVQCAQQVNISSFVAMARKTKKTYQTTRSHKYSRKHFNEQDLKPLALTQKINVIDDYLEK